jgi:phosphatidylinositol-3-phosphatase
VSPSLRRRTQDVHNFPSDGGDTDRPPMIVDTAAPTASPAAGRCAECQARLAHDQRYCLECGARRGPLPAQIAGLVGAFREQGPAPELPPGAPLADAVTGAGAVSRGGQLTMPGPRAAAVAVMAMLGFGVIVGSLVGGTSVATLASAPLLVVGLGHTTPAAQVIQSAAPSDTSGGDGGSGGGGAAAAPAAVTTQAAASPSTSPTPVSGGSTGTTPATGYGGLPPVKHVFLIVLSDRGITKSFDGGSSAGYLGGALRRQGELLLNYYAVAGSPLANEVAMISGQGPTGETAANCPVFSRIRPAHKAPRGQILGAGCEYPPATKTLANQLTTAGDTWKAYLQGVSPNAKTACKVPKAGSTEPQVARTTNGYLAWRNPFVYFRSLTKGGTCRLGEVGLGQLANDLKSASTTPSLSYIVPSPCADGSEALCKPHTSPGLAGANRFLKLVVPEIKRSVAYKDDGLIAITFDQAPQTGPDADQSACCGPSSYPNLATLATPPEVPPAAMGPEGTYTATTTTTGTTTTDTTATGTTTSGTSGTTGTTGTTTTDTSATGTTTTGTTPTSTTPATGLGGETIPTGGGGQVGLLLISQYVKPNSTDPIDYFNHFSLLGSLEGLFGLKKLGYAGVPGLSLFGTSVYNNYAG